MIKIQREDEYISLAIATIFAKCEEAERCLLRDFSGEKSTHRISITHDCLCSINFLDDETGTIHFQYKGECLISKFGKRLEIYSRDFFGILRKEIQEINNYIERKSALVLILHWLGTNFREIEKGTPVLLNSDLAKNLVRFRQEFPAQFERETNNLLKGISDLWFNEYTHRLMELPVSLTNRSRVSFILWNFYEGLKEGLKPLPAIESDQDREELERIVEKIIKETDRK